MSVQLIVYPQSYEGGYNVISSSTTEFIVNGINFNALGVTATYSSPSATPFLDTFINAPATTQNTWFRFISTTAGTPAFPSVSTGSRNRKRSRCLSKTFKFNYWSRLYNKG